MRDREIHVIPIVDIPIIERDDDISEIIVTTLESNRQEILRGDILVVTHKIISKSEGRVFDLLKVNPSKKAIEIAEKVSQPAKKVEIALQESTEIIREDPILITKTEHGLITDLSGVDQSNAPENTIIALPLDPYASATKLNLAISKVVGFNVPVVISDTQGRPWRKGAINIAIGVAGMSSFTLNAGEIDRFGKKLRSSLVCLVDEIASAAELVMGQADEKIPAVIVRGISFRDADSSKESIVREKSENLFL